MKTETELKRLYDFAAEKAGKLIRKIGEETAERLGGEMLFDEDGMTAMLSITDERLTDEFGTEDTAPKPWLISETERIKKKFDDCGREDLWI